MSTSTKRKKARKQTVYVLTGGFNYERTCVLGVYSTRRRAEKAEAADTGGFDDYTIDAVVVNA